MTIVTVTVNPAVDLCVEVERVVPERKLRCSSPVFHPGGGGINVARVATRLGADATAVWIGGGSNAEKLAALLSEEQVSQRCVPVLEEPRLSLHVEERATGQMYRFVLPGPDVSPQQGELLAAGVQSLVEARFVVISGSLPPSLPVDYFADLAARVADGARVILDTSGDALDRGLAGHVYLAKPNRRELGQLARRELSGPDDVIGAARALIDAGRVEVVAVSLGAEGMTLVTREAHAHLAAPRVTAISAVGAGDSAVAGIVVGLARGLELVDAARLGVAAGTAAVLTAGTELCRREDVERLYREVSIDVGDVGR